MTTINHQFYALFFYGKPPFFMGESTLWPVNHYQPSPAAKKQTSTETSLLQADPEWQTALVGRSFPAFDVDTKHLWYIWCVIITYMYILHDR